MKSNRLVTELRSDYLLKQLVKWLLLLVVATSFESTLIDFKIVVTLISESIHIAVQKQLILNFVGAVINFIQ